MTDMKPRTPRLNQSAAPDVTTTKGEMNHLKDEMDLWAQDFTSAQAEANEAKASSEQIIHELLDDLAMAAAYQEFCLVASDDYSELHCSYHAVVATLRQFRLTDAVPVPNALTNPGEFIQWRKQYLPLIWNRYWNS